MGKQVEFRASGGVITITPKMAAADEYTSEQRRIVDTELAEAAKGPFHGPFGTADEMIAHLRVQLNKRAATNKPKRAR